MATFKICVFGHQQRIDGKFPVSIRVTWKRKQVYISTEYYVSLKQLKIIKHNIGDEIKNEYELKDNFIIKELLNRISIYEDLKVKKLGSRIDSMSAKELADYFVIQTSKKQDENIDLVSFTNELISKTKNKGTSDMFFYTLGHLKKFTKSEKIPFSFITLKFLKDFEGHLYNEGVRQGIHNYMRTFRTILYAARDTYNDEETGDIQILNPFKKYEMPLLRTPEKRALLIEQIKTIRDIDNLTKPREIISRDLFMLSFYLVGMNTADFYNLEYQEGERLSYYRTKTTNRRQDGAYISIKIEPEALPLIEKYKDPDKKRMFNFYNRYADFKALNKAINQGLKDVGKNDKIKIPDLTFYHARHSWATIGRNDCMISKDDIHESLNHSDRDMKITDGYIKKDWSVIDRANRAILDKIKG
jgi:integrase